MIVSFARGFIFVAIPKTATHAVRTALRPHLGPRDWEQCVLFEPKYFPVDALAAIGHGHISCREIRPFLLPETWHHSLRFCTVRNPYDRFASYCFFINRDNRLMQEAPLETMKRVMTGRQAPGPVLLRPQSTFVVDDDGQLLVDCVCRFETLQQDFNQVCGRLGLTPAPLPRVNAAQTRDTVGFDRELEALVRQAYRDDFVRFNYPVEIDAAASCHRLQ